jgi:hypothetical protein
VSQDKHHSNEYSINCEHPNQSILKFVFSLGSGSKFPTDIELGTKNAIIVTHNSYLFIRLRMLLLSNHKIFVLK